MMKKLLLIVPLLYLSACGANEELTEEPLVLDEFKDRLGYVLGSLNAESILSSGDRMEEMNKELIIQGFSDNFSTKDCSDCDGVLLDLFGPYFQDFDTNHIDAGSTCLGRKTGFAFYDDMMKMGGLEKMNHDLVKAGFRHGIYGTDSLIAETERRTMIQNFITDLNVINGDKMMASAKSKNGADLLESGIVMFTIEEGTGGMPGPTDDVEVEYILTSSLGDTVQSSYEVKKMSGTTDPVALSLDGGVIPGWSVALPMMKKGGKYRIYIPWNLAYGERGGKESLCFLIEMINYGPKGTLLKEQPQVPGGL